MESIYKSEIDKALLETVAGVIEPHGFRVVDLDCRIGGRSILRIYIERVADDSSTPGTPSPGTSLENCTQVSRLLGPVLEADPRIPGAFDLEVSSPGLDRRLRLQSDFESTVGNEVKLKLLESLPGKGANVHGRLTKVENAHVVVAIGKEEISIPWQQIKQANRVWNF